jgi:hypothetical protein
MPSISRTVKDGSFKMILGDHELFVQFLHDFVKMDIFSGVTPEDIEDISERFITMGLNSKDGDTVKKIKLKDKQPLFVVGLAEHQQKVNYRMSFRFLQYSVFIWLDYEKEQEALRKGSTELKGFKYPPVLPVVYYTGESRWTAPLNFHDKVYFNEVFKPYIPNFEYMLVNAGNYTQADLLANRDILSLFLLIDKIKYAEQITQLREIPQEFFDMLEAKTPEHLREMVRNIAYLFLKKLDVPEQELDEFASKIKSRRLSEMFGLIDGYSVTKTRAEARAETQAKDRAEFACNLLLENMDIQKIARLAMLPLERVIEIKNTMQLEGRL